MVSGGVGTLVARIVFVEEPSGLSYPSHAAQSESVATYVIQSGRRGAMEGVFFPWVLPLLMVKMCRSL